MIDYLKSLLFEDTIDTKTVVLILISVVTVQIIQNFFKTTATTTTKSEPKLPPKKGVSFGEDTSIVNIPTTKKNLDKKPSLNKVQTVGRLLNDNFFAQSVTKSGRYTGKKTGHLKNIFSQPLGDLFGYVAPVYPKTRMEKNFIQNAFKNNFVFQTLLESEDYDSDDEDRSTFSSVSSRPSSMKEENIKNTLINAFQKIIYDTLGTAIIEQGDTNADYFYILEKGQVKFVIDGKEVGMANPGKSFGELSLLYTSPRAASCVTATDNCVLWRLDQRTFRSILQSGETEEADDKKRLLKEISFMKDLDDFSLSKLIDILQLYPFAFGDQIVKKGETGDAFYIIKEGEVKVTDISVGNATYQDVILKKGDYFGERSLTTKEPRAANIIALSNGLCYKIDAKTFRDVCGNLDSLMQRAADERRLRGIKAFSQSLFDDADYKGLCSVITRHEYEPNEIIAKEGEKIPARLFFVREGTIELSSNQYPSYDGKKYTEGSFFGEQCILADQASDCDDDTEIPCKYTIKIVSDEKAVVGCLFLSDARTVIDTTLIGLPLSKSSTLNETDIKYDELVRHSILGQGTFGQVWLCTRKKGTSDDTVYGTENSNKTPYALKIQSKYQLIQSAQAKGVVNERNIMTKLKSKFIIPLISSYQDTARVYLLLKVLQGGELYSLIYPTDEIVPPGVGEKSAKFYSAGILEGLSYMHRRDILFRDLKPENVLIDSNGYPVLIDLGFAKQVTGKTFTLCGTPLYLAPEVIMNKGHDKGADHWSLGVFIFEMIVGETPFYSRGCSQIDLFRNIASGKFSFPSNDADRQCSPDAETIIKGLLTPRHTNRLGSKAKGISEIYTLPWYANKENGISFTKLRRTELEAPWLPDIKDSLDTSNFESWNQLEDKGKEEPPVELTSEEQELFKEFPSV